MNRYILLLFFCIVTCAVHAQISTSNNILPILSDYCDTIKINGQLTTQCYAQIAVSDLNDHGTFTVGSSTVEINAHDAIEFLYTIQEVSSVAPINGKGLAKASEVADLDTFVASSAYTGQSYNSIQTTNPGGIPGITSIAASNSSIHYEQIRSRAQRSSSSFSRVMNIQKTKQTRFDFPSYSHSYARKEGGFGLNSPRRKLLQDFGASGVAALILATADHFEIEKIKDQMGAMNDKITDNTNMITAVATNLTSLTGFTHELAQNLTLQVGINNITANNLNKVQDQVLNITNAINATDNALRQLNIDVTNNMTAIVNGTKAALARLQQSFNSSFATIYGELSNLYSLSGNLTESQMEMNNRITANIQALGRQLRSSLSLAWDAAQGVSIERSLTASLFESAAGIPNNTFILKTDDGSPPLQGGLNGTFSRLFIERVIISWIEVSDISSQSTPITGYREDFTIWVDTMFGISNDKPWNTWDDIISLMGPEICVRPYTDADFPLDAVDVTALATNAPGCMVWIESKKTSCTIDTNKLPNGFTLQQSGALDNTVCQTGSTPTTPTGGNQVFRNLDVFNNYVATLYNNPSRKHSANTLLTQMQRVQGRTIVQGPLNPADAYIPWNIAQNTLNYITLSVWMNSAIILSFPFIQSDMKDREQFIFGRSFDGVAESLCPISATPTIRQYDPETHQLEILYNGAAKKTRCKQLEYRYVSDMMIELNNAQPYSIKPVNTNVTILTITPTGNGSFVNPVTTTEITTSITYNVDGAQLLPSNLWILGSVDPSVYGVTFDIPDKMICGVRAYDDCKGMVDFYNDEPGVRITPSLAQWVNKSTDRAGYTPLDFGGSPSTFMRGFVFDDEGYPQCNVPGGVSSADLLKQLVNGGTFKPTCRGSFNWFEGTINNQQTNIKCNGIVDPSHLWYSDNATLVAATNDANSNPGGVSILLQPWYFSFQYRTTQSSYAVMTLVTSTVKLVITGGSSLIVNINNGASIASVPIHHDVEDGVHNVWIQWDPTNSHTLTIYSDLIQVLVVPNFVITASSGLGNTGATIGNGGGVSSLTDVLFALRYNNVIYDVPSVLMYGSCHYSKVLPNRCDVPTDPTSSPVPNSLPDSRSIVYAYQIPNPNTNPECGNSGSGSMPDSILLTDPVATQSNGGHLLASGANDYTLSWWSDRVDFSSGSYVSMVTLGGWTISVVTGSVKFTNSSNPSSSQTFNFPVSASGLNLASTNAHYFMLVSNSIDASLKMFIDKIEVTPSSGTYPAIASDSRNVATSIVFAPRFTMGRLFPNDALNSQQRVTMFNCELGTTITDTSSWRTPLATCIVSSQSTQSAYCRYSSMCSGKCSMFTAHLNLQSKTFYMDSIQCDPYYEGANCQTLCPRTTTKGYCLADTDPYRPLTNVTTLQSVPGSELCNLFKHFKVKELPPLANGQRLLSIIPRRWSAVISAGVPQGDIVQSFTTGVCPTVSASAFNSTLLGFKLTNPSNLDTIVRVVWASTASDLSQDDPNCIDLFNLGDTGEQMTITANYYVFFKTPPCVNTQIQIQRFVGPPTNWENCGSPIDSITFPDIIATSVFVPESVTTALVISQDQTYQAINQQVIANAITQAKFDYQSALASNAGQARLDSIQVWQAHLQNITQAQINGPLLTYNDLLNMPVNGTVGGTTFDAYLAQSASLAASTAASAQDRSDIDLLKQKNAQLQAALDNISALLGNLSDAEAASLADYLARIAIDNKKFEDASSESFPNPLGALGSAANWVDTSFIPGIGNGLGNLLGGGGSGLFGGIGAWIGSFISKVVEFIVIGLLLYGLYLLYEWYTARQEKKQMSHAVNELSALTEKPHGRPRTKYHRLSNSSSY